MIDRTEFLKRIGTALAAIGLGVEKGKGETPPVPTRLPEVEPPPPSRPVIDGVLVTFGGVSYKARKIDVSSSALAIPWDMDQVASFPRRWNVRIELVGDEVPPIVNQVGEVHPLTIQMDEREGYEGEALLVVIDQVTMTEFQAVTTGARFEMVSELVRVAR